MTAVEQRGSAARLLDVTRLLSRAGRVLTGIDRVERAWLAQMLREEGPVFGLARTGLGYLLLDRRGLGLLAGAFDRQEWGPVGWLARLPPQRPVQVRAAETLLRRAAIARCVKAGLGPMLRRHLPEGTTACFVGHANLSERTLSALRSVPGLCLQVMIHDTIPLDWPAFQRAGTPEAFAAKLDAVARHADVIICPTRSAAADVARHLAPRGARATVVVAPLGVEIAAPDPAAVPAGVPVREPYFVVLGTIEPRKNHGLLLDAWEMLGPSAPWLLVCGTRGWRNEATFARLDRHPDRVMELAGLTDGAITALLQDARALLFPSLAEGYGLPLAEAGALGTPVICSDLPVCREVAAADAEFLDPHDAGAWAAAVSRHRALATDRKRQTAPDWVSHFKIALAMT